MNARKPEWTDPNGSFALAGISRGCRATTLSSSTSQHRRGQLGDRLASIRAVGSADASRALIRRNGHIFDHFAIEFEYPNGARVMSMCRPSNGNADHVGERFTVRAGTRTGEDHRGPEPVQVRGRVPQPVRPGACGSRREHPRGLAHEGKQVAESTLSAIRDSRRRTPPGERVGTRCSTRSRTSFLRRGVRIAQSAERADAWSDEARTDMGRVMIDRLSL